jgi:hypothetical protein
MKRFIYHLTPCLLIIVGIITVSGPAKTSAVSASDWKAGRIIDDSVFTNSTSMTAQEVQNFLNARVPVCDTNGTQLTGRWYAAAGRYYTRAEWGALNGNPAPFTCLKDFWEVPKTDPAPGQPANNYGGAAIPAGAKSAAQIIWDAAQRYQISPKVLLTTIQKESYGPLTSDDWPYRSQYEYPMGAYCPDTAPCDPNYEGFSIQIYESARLFRYYLNNMGQSWWPYKKPNQVNSILYNPNSACGSSNVFIESSATAALYTYTPYQPNAAALANMYGTGDGCSAYGNRNFWRIFSDWFGSTTRINGGITLETGILLDKGVYYQNDTVSAGFTIKNSSSVDTFVGQIGICARMNGQNYDFGTLSLNLAGNSQRTINFTKKIQQTGVVSIFICTYYEPLGGWLENYYPYAPESIPRRRDALITVNPVITNSITLSPAQPSLGENTLANFTVQNLSNNPITFVSPG